jgi:arylsulfatase A-like enzyme
MSEKQNVIMITLDGARIDVMKELPNFQNTMSQGITFPTTITYAPFTIGAMHALCSGTYGYHNGVNCYYASPNFKKNKFETIASYLQSQGYSTEANVLNLICVPSKGFDIFKEHDPDNDDLVPIHTKLLENAKENKDKGKNFFTHLHYSKIQNSIKINVSRKVNNFTQEYFDNQPQNLEKYKTYAQTADEYLKEMMDKISELELDDSLIIIHSDHGMGTGEKFGEKAYGVYCYDYTLKAFTVFIHKDNIQTRQVQKQVRTIDILPTIIDHLQIPINKDAASLDGRSLTPYFEGKEMEPIEAYAESGNPFPDPKVPPKKPNVKAVRTNQYKMIRHLWDNNREELFNLEQDPEEKNNIIKENEEAAKEMRDLLNKHAREAMKLEIQVAIQEKMRVK